MLEIANLDSVSIHSLLNTERADAVEIKNPKKTQRKDSTTVKISNKSSNTQSTKMFDAEQLIRDIEEINLLECIK